MTIADVPEPVRADLARMEIVLSEETLTLLAKYLDLLLEVNQQFNLTAIRDRDQAWRRHILDSLTLVPILADLPDGATVIDVGSGGGLPGIPLAIARPGLRVTLLETTQKKARFLERCVKELPLPAVKVVCLRAETAGQDPQHRQRYDAAVCRAVGPLVELLECTLPLVRVSGRLLAMKGPRVEEELDVAADAMQILGAGEMEIVPAFPDEFEMDTVIVSIIKDRITPRAYPRAPGIPRQSPLGSE